MFNERVTDSVNDNFIKVMADYIISNLDEVQNGQELNDLRNNSNLEIRQEADLIFEEIQQLKAKIKKI